MPNRVLNTSAPGGKSRKYARVERERRFLLANPPDLEAAVRTVRIVDRYFRQTRMRLRQTVDTSASAPLAVYKLTQKVAAADGGPGLITTMYLSEKEYQTFAAVPADELRKTRYSIPPFGVDRFERELEGLTLAEVEFESDAEMRDFAAPAAAEEVTRDARFSGGRLATTTRDELAAILSSFGLRPGSRGTV
jgi:CYTH domain-containing protein